MGRRIAEPSKGRASAKTGGAAALAGLPEDDLLEAVQRQTFRFFVEGSHPVSGLAPDRRASRDEPDDDLIGSGGSGFGIMAHIVAVERGWMTREEAVDRIGRMVDVLIKATCYHGAFPHFMNGRTGATIPFSRKDDGGDIVETSYLVMGLLCARQYFIGDGAAEKRLRQRIGYIWGEVEWNWYTQGGRKLLYWHWSPNNGWVLDHEIHGWNECLITYVLGASSPRYPIDAQVYHRCFASSRDYINGRPYYGIELPLGPTLGGPLFFAHYSFCGLDPRGLKDRYADYWEQTLRHVSVNRAHCIANPNGHKGYGEALWGLTASDDPHGYDAHAPDNDNGTISPTAALASYPYAPKEALAVMRHLLAEHGDRAWGRYGFIDALNPSLDWYAETFLAIDQGPIIVMIENHRTELLWRLFMSVPEVQAGLRRLDFTSPWLAGASS